jgi:hypothetical protein
MAIKLYTALVNPHLIHGCEVMPNVNNTALALLTDVQKVFLQQVHALSKWSIISILFTKTGTNPLEVQQLDLVLGYWIYMVTIPQGRTGHALAVCPSGATGRDQTGLSGQE